jgi:hypothetical protein
MVQLPEFENVSTRIYNFYEEKARREQRREHLGCSELGNECERALWLSFRWAQRAAFSGRILRIFETGKKEEERVIQNLKECMFQVLDLFEGQQIHYSLFGGHLGGSVDGLILGIPEAPKTWHLLELKTHNERAFKDIEKNGVFKSKPVYWAQTQMYMGLSQTQGPHKLNRCLYIGVNKNTDDMYHERYEFDKIAFDKLCKKAERIIFRADLPSRISEDISKKPCAWCNYKEVCFKQITPEKNCRTCVHADAMPNGLWGCKKHQFLIEKTMQETGCLEHEFLADLK